MPRNRKSTDPSSSRPRADLRRPLLVGAVLLIALLGVLALLQPSERQAEGLDPARAAGLG